MKAQSTWLPGILFFIFFSYKPAMCVCSEAAFELPIIYGVRYSVCTSSRIKYRGIFQRVCAIFEGLWCNAGGAPERHWQVESTSLSLQPLLLLLRIYFPFHCFNFFFLFRFIWKKSLNLPSYFLKVVISCFVYALCTLPSFIYFSGVHLLFSFAFYCFTHTRAGMPRVKQKQ